MPHGAYRGQARGNRRKESRAQHLSPTASELPAGHAHDRPGGDLRHQRDGGRGKAARDRRGHQERLDHRSRSLQVDTGRSSRQERAPLESQAAEERPAERALAAHRAAPARTGEMAQLSNGTNGTNGAAGPNGARAAGQSRGHRPQRTPRHDGVQGATGHQADRESPEPPGHRGFRRCGTSPLSAQRVSSRTSGILRHRHERCLLHRDFSDRSLGLRRNSASRPRR